MPRAPSWAGLLDAGWAGVGGGGGPFGTGAAAAPGARVIRDGVADGGGGPVVEDLLPAAHDS